MANIKASLSMSERQQRVATEQHRISAAHNNLTKLLFSYSGRLLPTGDKASARQKSELAEAVEAAFKDKDREKPVTVKLPKAVLQDLPTVVTEDSLVIGISPTLHVESFRTFKKEIDTDYWTGKFTFRDSLTLPQAAGAIMLDRSASVRSVLFFNNFIGAQEVPAPVLEVSAVTGFIEAALESGTISQ